MPTDAPTTVHQLAYHRNGVGGEGFFACHFVSAIEGDPVNFLGVVFLPDCAHDADGYMTDPDTWPHHNQRVAVFSTDLLPSVEFGHNSWRGDQYADDLYRAIYAHDQAAR